MGHLPLPNNRRQEEWMRLLYRGIIRFLHISSEMKPSRRSTSRGGESVLASRRLTKRDGIPHHTGVGKGPLFLIYCLPARTAREDALPTSDRLLIFLSHDESQYSSTRNVVEPILWAEALRGTASYFRLILGNAAFSLLITSPKCGEPARLVHSFGSLL